MEQINKYFFNIATTIAKIVVSVFKLSLDLNLNDLVD